MVGDDDHDSGGQLMGWQTLPPPSVIGDLGDVDTTTDTPIVGDVLKWDGSNWVPAEDLAESGGAPGSVSFSGASVYRITSDQSISADTVTAVEFNGEEYDTDTYHDNSTNPSRLTAPSDGKYHISGSISMLGLTGTGTQIRAAVDGTLTRMLFRGVGSAFDDGGSVTLSFAFTEELSSGSYVEILVFQAGDAFDIRNGSVWSHCQIHKVAGS